MSPPTNNWRQRQPEQFFYAEIVTDITTLNCELKDTWQDKKDLTPPTKG